MSKVTIKGRVSTTVLRRGEVETVERTDAIDALVARGYVTVVGDEPVSMTGAVTPQGDTPVEHEQQADDELQAPAQSASRVDWVEFLTQQGFGVTDEDSRDDLVALWHGNDG